jgi:uncharacterized membrane protein
MIGGRTNRGLAFAALLGGVALAAAVLAAPDPNRRLILAVYQNEVVATAELKMLRSAQDQGAIRMDSYAVVSKEPGGKLKVIDQRKDGGVSSAVVGAVVGLLGGGGAAYLTSVGMSMDTVKKIQGALRPGEAAVMTVVDEKWAVTAERLQRADATRAVTYTIPATASANPPSP